MELNYTQQIITEGGSDFPADSYHIYFQVGGIGGELEENW